MGHYAQVSDVKQELRDAVVRPSDDSRIETYIAEAEDFLDIDLALRWHTPVIQAESPRAFGIIKLVVAQRAAGRFLRWAAQATNAPCPSADDLESLANAWMTRLAKTDIVSLDMASASAPVLRVPTIRLSESRQSCVFDAEAASPLSPLHP